jgi:uncharacterized protein (DUF488 family)
MKTLNLYSIGHGNQSEESFIKLLKEHAIDFVGDVRSIPYSKYNPHFNREQLKPALAENGIRYLYMGDQLGGRPGDPGCYNANGKIDYSILSEKDFFKEGIRRLVVAAQKNIRLAIMCSETDPEKCHRSKLIGKVLAQERIQLLHITGKKIIVSGMPGLHLDD